MKEKEEENKLSHWFSTYGTITAERLLGKYQIKLNHNQLLSAIKDPHSFYRRLLHVPLKNVLNGIVLQQAYDYQVYAQKLFIDYLLSFENPKSEEEEGASQHDALEKERQQLLTLCDQFQTVQYNHAMLIANSQSDLITLTKNFNAELEDASKALSTFFVKLNYPIKKSLIRQSISEALIHYDVSDPSDQNQHRLVEKMNEFLQLHLTEEIKEKIIKFLSKILEIDFNLDKKMDAFIDDVQEINQLANSYRTQFYEMIVRVIDLLKTVPGYKVDPLQDAINKESLYFDSSIGINTLK